MRQEQFLAMMPYISTDLVATIVEKQNVSEEEAIKKLYDSRLYAVLEDEQTKVWQYSTSMLYSLLVQEEKSGQEVWKLFDRYGVFAYLREFYDVLHTTGHQYINHDIDIYLESRGAKLPE